VDSGRGAKGGHWKRGAPLGEGPRLSLGGEGDILGRQRWGEDMGSWSAPKSAFNSSQHSVGERVSADVLGMRRTACRAPFEKGL